MWLRVYAAFAFDMFENYCDDNPPMIHVYLSVEPSDIHDFFAIVESEPDLSKKIEGMVQVTGAAKNTESEVLTGLRLDIWRKCSAKCSKGTKLFFIQFMCSRSPLSWNCCIPLTERALNYARSSPMYDYLTPEGEAEAPMNKDVAIQFVHLVYTTLCFFSPGTGPDVIFLFLKILEQYHPCRPRKSVQAQDRHDTARHRRDSRARRRGKQVRCRSHAQTTCLRTCAIRPHSFSRCSHPRLV